MLNLFKTNQPTVKTVNEVIEEIHESFYTEVDKLLSDAKVSKSLDTDKQNLIDKCKRLQSLGFTSTLEVKEATKEINRLDTIKKENETKKDLIEAINYFSFKYPNYKFITEESVKKICKKYGLVYGAIDKYIGTVPDRNLKHIEDFNINESDWCYIKRVISMYSWTSDTTISYIDFKEYQHHEQSPSSFRLSYHTAYDICSLEIAAPQKDFEVTGSKIDDCKISYPDPVVLKPVFHGGKKHYLIVTAWGIEASDSLVVNEKMN